jgi:hypothetical protein
VRNLRGRADELPLAASLSDQVSNLRVMIGEVRSAHRATPDGQAPASFDHAQVEAGFARVLEAIGSTLEEYREHLHNNNPRVSLINDSRGEWATMYKIDATLAEILAAARDPDWTLDAARLDTIQDALARLQTLARQLPEFLH